VLEAQVQAFRRGKERAGPAAGNTLSLQRGIFLVRSEAERQRIVGLAHRYYQSFDNVFGGPGILDRGIIRPLPRTQSEDELGRNLLVCTRDEMIDRLGEYDRLGIDEVIVTSVYGQDEAETLDMMQGLAEEVFPAFRSNMS